MRNESHAPTFSFPAVITSGRNLYSVSARMPATRTLLVIDPRQACAGVLLTSSSPLRMEHDAEFGFPPDTGER